MLCVFCSSPRGPPSLAVALTPGLYVVLNLGLRTAVLAGNDGCDGCCGPLLDEPQPMPFPTALSPADSACAASADAMGGTLVLRSIVTARLIVSPLLVLYISYAVLGGRLEKHHLGKQEADGPYPYSIFTLCTLSAGLSAFCSPPSSATQRLLDRSLPRRPSSMQSACSFRGCSTV